VNNKYNKLKMIY